MGNWRRVMVEGTCPAEHVAALGEMLDPGKNYENFHCLVCGGVCGLPNWAAESFSVVGNLAERGYDAQDVAETLGELAKDLPGLEVKVHCGGDYEADECVATVTLEGGKATVGEPERETIPHQSIGQVQGNFLAQLVRQRGR